MSTKPILSSFICFHIHYLLVKKFGATVFEVLCVRRQWKNTAWDGIELVTAYHIMLGLCQSLFISRRSSFKSLCFIRHTTPVEWLHLFPEPQEFLITVLWKCGSEIGQSLVSTLTQYYRTVLPRLYGCSWFVKCVSCFIEVWSTYCTVFGQKTSALCRLCWRITLQPLYNKS